MFRELKLPHKSTQWQPTQLQQVAEKIGSELVKKPNVPNTKSQLPRRVDEIISDIQNEQVDNITQLDWVYCLYAKTQWDSQNVDKSKATSEAIWQIAKNKDWLKRRLFWRLAVYYSQLNSPPLPHSPTPPLSPSLVETFPEFARNPSGSDGLALQILKILQNQTISDLAKLSWQYLRTPQDLLDSAGLPRWLKASEIALDSVAGIFAKNKVSGNPEVEWLLRCLKQMSTSQQLGAVEEIVGISGEALNRFPQLIEWLRGQYAPENNSENWSQLSDAARACLTRWTGTANYGYFQTLINLLVRMLKLPDEERQDLEQRRDFWANYSDRIQRIRLFLPESSITALGYQLQIKVDVLAEDKSESTEICIFDFGHYYVLEFLRGAGREARLIPRSPKNEYLLFHPTKLSAKQLRRLGGEVCDRVFFWQPTCERWLYNHNIRPNVGIEYFKGLPKYQGKYNPNNGLLLPTEKEQKQRDVELKQWRREMEKLLQATR